MLDLFTNTDTFFKRRINEKEEFRTPLIIIGMMWLAGVLNLALVFSFFLNDIPHDIINSLLIIVAIGMTIGLIGNFFIWFLCSGIFYLVSVAFHGKGSFYRVLEFSSYGFIPYIVNSVVSSIYMWRLLSNIDVLSLFETIDANSDPSILFNELLFSDIPGTVILTFFAIVMFILSVYIWIYGMKHARDLSLKKAFLTVGIPSAAYVIYEAFMLLLLVISYS